MDCILKCCAHPKQEACKTLGECGAAHALEQSRSSSGYEVHVNANPTIKALLRGGLVTESGFNGRTMVVRAVAERAR